MDEELRDKIRQFGLTEKETDTYLTILQNGPATVTEIAKAAEISKRHVYTVARKLEERHLVIVNDYFTPTTIEAAPPEEVYEQLKEQASDMYRILETKYHGSNQLDDIKVLKSRSTVINRLEEMIHASEDQLALSLPAVVIPTLQDALRDAVARDVLVLLLVFEDRTEVGTDPLAGVSLDGLATLVRYRDSNQPVMLAADSKSAFVSSRGVITRPNSPVKAISIEQPYMETVVFTSLMNSLWVNSDEVSVTPPNELPHTYRNLRRAAIDATIYGERGAVITAEIEARACDHPDSVVNLVGEVEGVKQRLISPTTDPRPRQCCICLRTEEGTVTVGNHDAFFEDYRAYKTTLRFPE
ncbi:TrmB family transcriptional regulator sugar-binding domain-containing protein [Halogeometricum luteum]|uniref:TrmB family transcriptional regulator n=1 Tax=Halogeometricum luteum TaxID=2950537 RepID=A0ABU2G3Q2_9EURY|nr:TrmB family transcriptional regulator sugar-binding domain-containing protein [Halogeometricum sp. S3BR5-2]MDS0295413.1 TrmB family transcriptional regulator [Halogeometricum sp. S3BR5-2]